PPARSALFPYTTLFRSQTPAVFLVEREVARWWAKVLPRSSTSLAPIHLSHAMQIRGSLAGGRDRGAPISVLRRPGAAKEPPCCQDRKSTRLNSSHQITS